MNEFEFRYPLLFRVGEKDPCAVVRTRKKFEFFRVGEDDVCAVVRPRKILVPFEDSNRKQRDASAFGHRMADALNAQSDVVRGDEVMAKLAANTVGLVAAVLELYFNDFEHDCEGGELCGHMLCHKCGCVVQKMIHARAALGLEQEKTT